MDGLFGGAMDSVSGDDIEFKPLVKRRDRRCDVAIKSAFSW